jgi:predicted NUDIX family phosphoesterase
MREETILCVEASDVTRVLGNGSGFITSKDSDVIAALRSMPMWLGPRATLEDRPAFRQLIPYIILAHGQSVVLYKRANVGGEKRLHHRLSLGFGGHIGISDLASKDGVIDPVETLARAGAREVNEEVLLPTVIARDKLGWIVDNSEPVSRVHLGVVELWQLSKEDVISAEPAIEQCLTRLISDLPDCLHMMEGWSQLCAEALTRSLRK